MLDVRETPTYRDLLKQLKTFTDEQLDLDVTVFSMEADAYSPAVMGSNTGPLGLADESQDVLDEGHPIIIISGD